MQTGKSSVVKFMCLAGIGIVFAALSVGADGCEEDKEPSCAVACDAIWDACGNSFLVASHDKCMSDCKLRENEGHGRNCTAAWEDVIRCCSNLVSGRNYGDDKWEYNVTTCYDTSDTFEETCSNVDICDGPWVNLNSCVGRDDDDDDTDTSGGGEQWGACPSVYGESCVAMNLGASSDPAQAKQDFQASCAMTHDNDSGKYIDGKCPTDGAVGVCRDATGTLESTGEKVPIEAVWYQAACDMGLDPRSTCTNQLGSSNFSGPGC